MPKLKKEWQKTGLPIEEILRRFYSRVNFNGPLYKKVGTKCWEWTGNRSRKNYGQFHFMGETHLSHRLIFEWTYGLPKDMCVCHHCDNPPCVNPTHLFYGTNNDNVKDSVLKNRRYHPIGEKHPMFGKHFSEESKKRMSGPRTGNYNNSGINNPMFGKKHSEITKKIMSEKALLRLNIKYV